MSVRPAVLGPRIGLALSATSLWATAGRALRFGTGTREVRTRELEPMGDGTEWADLAIALQELSAELGESGGTVSVALLPPLVQLRRIDLPPVTDAEAQRVLSRNAGRYFLGVREPQAVAVVRDRQGFKRGGSVLASAASARVVNAVLAAVRSAGWRVAVVAPAHAAWVAAAKAQSSAVGRQSTRLVVLRDEGTELIHVDGGSIETVRHFGTGPSWVSDLAEAAAEPGPTGEVVRLLAIGDEPRRRELSEALRDRGVSLSGASSKEGGLSDTPEALAATHASSVADLDLLPEHAHSEREGLARRATVGLAAATLLLLGVVAGAEIWGLKRELAVVEAERATVREGVGQVLEARTMIDAMNKRLAALRPLESNSIRWSTVLGTLARTLPRDAHLVSFSGVEDSIVVEGLAPHATGTFQALQRAPGFFNVQTAGTIRREVTDSGATLERFLLSARLAARDTTPVSRSGTPGRGTRGSTPRGASPRGATPGGAGAAPARGASR